MSEAFTPITQGQDWQSMDAYNQCVLAYYERRCAAAIGQEFETNPLEAGDDIQSITLWTEIQNWLETHCVDFVNHTATIEGETSVPMFTLATWRVAAGLDVDGFRRATEWIPDPTTPDWTDDPEFCFGLMQVGDIIGPWLLHDLQKGLSALKWTKEPGVDPDLHVKSVWHSGSVSCEDERNHTIANWTSGPYSENWYAHWEGETDYRSWARSVQSRSGTWRFDGSRTDTTWRFYRGVNLPIAYDFYGLARGIPESGPPYYFPAVPFQDIDSLGLTENKLHLLGTKAENSDSPQEQNVGGTVTACPVQLISGALCPVGSTSYERTAVISETWWILKWNFTNSL